MNQREIRLIKIDTTNSDEEINLKSPKNSNTYHTKCNLYCGVWEFKGVQVIATINAAPINVAVWERSLQCNGNEECTHEKFS